MNFSVGDVVAITDGKNTALSRIEGIRRGHLRIGYLLFDWCGNEVDTVNPIFKIYPIKDVEKIEITTCKTRLTCL